MSNERVSDDDKRCPPHCLSCADGPKSARHAHQGHPPAGAAPWLVDLHADSEEAHDFVTSAGAFVRTLALLEEARSKGQAVEVRTWLTRATFRHLRRIPRLLTEAKVHTWHLFAMPWDGDRATPRLAMAWPRALRAAKEADAAGVTVITHGGPRCVLGPYARFAAKETPGAFGAKCQRCVARVDCVGVDAGYLARFGDEDLRALR